MTQREFERKIKKLVPSITQITYGKKLEGQKFEYDSLYIHTSQKIERLGTTRRGCHLRLGKDCMERMIKMFEDNNEPTN